MNTYALTQSRNPEQLQRCIRDCESACGPDDLAVAVGKTTLLTVVAAAKRVESENFHPLSDSDVLNQPGSTLVDYRVGDNRSRTSYVAQRLLKVVLLTYLKHHKGEDVIGWESLSDELHAAICEAIGDDEFCKWSDTTSKA